MVARSRHKNLCSFLAKLKVISDNWYKVKLLIKIVWGLTLFIAIERFCHKQTRGFTTLKIASDSPISGEKLPLDQQTALDAIFNQSFSFLNSGGQCYAFLSEDGKTIIKFFKQHHIRLWNRLNHMPLPQMLQPFFKRLLDKKIHQSPQFFESCRIADKDFKERCGLLYLHMHKTQCFKKKLKIIDNLGIPHLIDLDHTDFALQKRVELCHAAFKTLIRENNIAAAKQCIDSLIGLMREKSQKGIVDRDFNLRTNIGFLGTQAIEIDLGSFTKEEKEQDLTLVNLEKIQKFHRWLSKHQETLAQYFIEQIDCF